MISWYVAYIPNLSIVVRDLKHWKLQDCLLQRALGTLSNSGTRNLMDSRTLQGLGSIFLCHMPVNTD